MRRQTRSAILKVAITFALAGLVGVIGLVGWLAYGHAAETMLPAPSGPFAVGRTIETWVDPTRDEPLSPVPGLKRTLIAWIWYPAANAAPVRHADYLPALWVRALTDERGFIASNLITRDLARVHVHGRQDAAISPASARYPVVIMRAGLSALSAQYTVLAEELASHGYIVVGLDAPYRTAVVVLQDGTVIERAPKNDPERAMGRVAEPIVEQLVSAWTSDIGFALDRLARLSDGDVPNPFAGRLDMKHVGVFGHSLGGAQAAQFCHDDVRCAAGIDVDGALFGNVVREGLNRPFMFLTGSHAGERKADVERIEARLRAVFERVPPSERWWVEIPGANHFGFSDMLLSLGRPTQRILLTFGLLKIDPRVQLRIAGNDIRAFFDVYLKGAPRAALQTAVLQDPHVVLRR